VSLLTPSNSNDVMVGARLQYVECVQFSVDDGGVDGDVQTPTIATRSYVLSTDCLHLARNEG
jgi:hypothetical protein